MSLRREDLMAAMQGASANSGLVQAMQARLESLVGRPSGLIETLPKPIQRRIKYLRDLQDEYDATEEEYQKELDELDRKYAALYAPIFARRAEVVKGAIDAPKEVELEASEGSDSDTGPDGVPNFWLGVLQANEVTASRISEKDEAVLEFLVDIRSEELYGDDECGFRLTFDFLENGHFDNTVLTKTYHMVDSNEPVLERAVGSKIDWKAGKNVTVKTLKKKPKAGRGGKAGARPITKTEAVDSFFSFFSPPQIPEDGSAISEDELEGLQAALEEDYEVGETIRDELIPNAIRWYTGEIQKDSDEDEEAEEGEDAGSDELDDSDSEEGDDDCDLEGSLASPEAQAKVQPRTTPGR